jgi:hypothetical protein
LKPTFPALDQPITFPLRSVIVTIVLLKVERTWAMPVCTFLLPLALTIFGFSTSSSERDRFSFGGGVGAASSCFAFGAFRAGFAAGLVAGVALASSGTGVEADAAVSVPDSAPGVAKAAVADPSAAASAAFGLAVFFSLSAGGDFSVFFFSESAMG